MIDTVPRLRGRIAVWTALVCLSCTLPYWRALTLPAISDTYLQVWLGKKYLSPDTWPELAADALYRCRATSIWLTGATEALFGSNPIMFEAESILLHILNVALIVSFGQFSKIGYRITIPAALFWGFNERHHEAVIWYAALPEQLVFSFVLLTLFAWLKWWQHDKPLYYAASFGAFLLALLSKESGVVACALLAVPLVYEPRRWRRALRGAIPFLALSTIYFAFNIGARDQHLHWNDGTFKFGWHFLPVMFNSTTRLFSVWGFAALAVLIYFRRSLDWRLPGIALLWIPIALAPYSFVAYQPRVPSRHVYLASLGVAILLALAYQFLLVRRRVAIGLVLAYMVFNTSYIWFYKHDQFVERGEVTEHLIRDAKLITAEHSQGPLQVSCFPLSPEIASIALAKHLGLDESQIAVERSRDSSCGPSRVDLILD